MVSKNAEYYPDWKINKPVRNGLSIIYIIGIILLGASSGMIANKLFNQENRHYNEIAMINGREQLERKTESKSNNKKLARQQIEAIPLDTTSTIFSTGNNTHLQTPNVSDINSALIGYPYISLQIIANEPIKLQFGSKN